MKQIRKRLTYANVMSSLAVFLILGGATAFAAVQKIGANEIKANSIKTGKIVKEAVTAGKLKKNAVTESKIADGAVTTNKIANDAVTGDKVKESSLSEVPLAANANKLGGQSPSAFQQRVQWATVQSDGTILSQSGGISLVSHIGNEYWLNFGSSVVNRGAFVSFRYLNPDFDGYVASQPCSGPANTLACSASGTNNNPNVLYVQTHNAANSAVAEGFSVLVTP